MKVGENILWLKKGEEVPLNSRLIAITSSGGGYAYEKLDSSFSDAAMTLIIDLFDACDMDNDALEAKAERFIKKYKYRC